MPGWHLIGDLTDDNVNPDDLPAEIIARLAADAQEAAIREAADTAEAAARAASDAAETVSRLAEDAALRQDQALEAVVRAAVDNAEAAARAAADAAQTTSIAAETVTRGAADLVLAAELAAEKATREATAGYTHVQTEPATIWTIEHHLGYDPAGITVTSNNHMYDGFVVEYLEPGQTLRLVLEISLAGAAYLS